MRLRMLHGDRELPHCQRMMTFTDLASVPSHPLAPFTDRLRLAVAAYLARFKGSSRQHTESDLRCYLAWCAERGLDRWPRSDRTWSCTSGGCRRSAGSSPPPSPAGSRSQPGSTGPASSTASCRIRPPSTYAALRCPPNRPPWGSRTCSSRPCSPPPGSLPIHATSRWWPCSGCSACGSSKPPARTSPTSAKNTVTGSCACAARAPRSSWSRCRRQSAGPSTRAAGLRDRGPILLNTRGARMDRHAATRRLRHLAETAGIQTARAHPHMLRHTYVICTALAA